MKRPDLLSPHPISLTSARPARRPVAGWCLTAGLMACLAGLAGCAGTPSRAPSAKAASSDAPPLSQDAEGTVPAAPGATGARATGQDIATRHALFKVSAFDSLPGWQQDNLGEAWAAFKESCKSLDRKPSWMPLCAKVRVIKDARQARQFMEQEFTLLTVQNTDRTREGDITGYYEPLLQGRAQKDARFSVPVYGVPNDLYILDWKTVPPGQRKGVSFVKPNGRLLVPAQPGQPGAVAIDLRRFTLDTLDRRLRVRLQGNEALPYYTRADINQAAALDAPVLAWVDDPVALYAMQVQGTGRIRMTDGSILRLAYADQNGHPFKPMQLAASGNERVQTRGAHTAGEPGADEVEHFELADVGEAAAVPDAVAPGDEPLTRGARKAGGAGATPTDPAVSDAVAALLPPAGVKPTPPQTAPRLSSTPTPSPKPANKPDGSSQQLVDDLLTQASKGARKASQPPLPKSTSPVATKDSAATRLTQGWMQQRSKALDSDPSYVFFRPAPDQSAQAGPVGALGVPLTAGRSLAVDPRVMPLGYPVFLDAAGGDRRQPQMQRLMFAQDTGGAIRGAVRADYFWGFGADAGRQARKTKHRGRMWVLVPHAEVEALMSSKLLTRGAGVEAAQRDCLIADEAYCDDDTTP